MLQVAHNQRDRLRLRIVFFDQPAYTRRPSWCRAILCDFRPSPIIKAAGSTSARVPFRCARTRGHCRGASLAGAGSLAQTACLDSSIQTTGPDGSYGRGYTSRRFSIAHRKAVLCSGGIHQISGRDGLSLFFYTLRTVSCDIEGTSRCRCRHCPSGQTRGAAPRSRVRTQQ